MSEDEFTRLIKYMDVEFKKISERLEHTATKDEFDKLTGAIDSYAKQMETYMQNARNCT